MKIINIKTEHFVADQVGIAVGDLAHLINFFQLCKENILSARLLRESINMTSNINDNREVKTRF